MLQGVSKLDTEKIVSLMLQSVKTRHKKIVSVMLQEVSKLDT
jgi:hypothetical protein